MIRTLTSSFVEHKALPCTLQQALGSFVCLALFLRLLYDDQLLRLSNFEVLANRLRWEGHPVDSFSWNTGSQELVLLYA